MPETDYPDDRPPRNRNDYLQQTHWPLNGLVFLLPLLVFYHVGLLWCGQQAMYTLLAETHLSWLLQFFIGTTTPYLPAAAVVAVLLVQHAARKDPWRFRPGVLIGMVGESAVWMMPLLALALLVNKMDLAALAAPDVSVVGTSMQRVLLAVGAGIYEEFIFRLLFIGLAVLLLVNIFNLRKEPVALAAVVVSGVCFSLYHCSAGQLSNELPFPWFEFVFRAGAGVYLGLVYLYRGFAIAVGAHAAWDIYVFLFAA
ncbi:MAG: CPBP family intramembrane metalloprotease [Phycisphaerae bacterium]|nr:CPBP family intramembrane metalloprotease [Phycisphaerae bacterium]